MLVRSLAAALSVFALTACSGTQGSTSGSGGSPGAPPAATYEFKFTTHSGEETHWCQYMRAPEGDGKEAVVTGYEWSWQNMHHWALYRTTSDLPADVSFDQPFDCFEPGAMKYTQPGSLVLAGGETGEQLFPEGTGFGFKSGEILVFQAHTLNTTPDDVEASIKVSLHMGDPAVVKDRVGLIQFYDPYIVVPAHALARAQMRCAIPQDMTILFGTTHEHTRGTGVQVFLDPPAGDRATEPFLSSTDWQHPTVAADALAVAKGSHIRTSCDYFGDERDITQGQDKNDSEMCMFIGYYYPVVPADQGGGLFENCVQVPIPGGVGDEYGTGDKTCAESLACIQKCPPGDAPRPGDGRIDVGACWQKCLVGSCPSAAAPLNTLGYCVQNKCADACSGGNCAACVVQNCGAEYSACQKAACDK
jgi:hypothetical protein